MERKKIIDNFFGNTLGLEGTAVFVRIKRSGEDERKGYKKIQREREGKSKSNQNQYRKPLEKSKTRPGSQ